MVMQVSYHVEAPVEKVFDYFMDPESGAGQGMEVLEAGRTKEGVGTFLRWRVKVGRVPVLQGMEVVTEMVANEHITEQSSSAVVGTWEYAFEPDGIGTKITLTHSPRGLWALPGLSALVDLATTRLSAAYASTVKADLEAEATVPAQRKPARARKTAARKTAQNR
jgi:hypothetical protein